MSEGQEQASSPRVEVMSPVRLRKPDRAQFKMRMGCDDDLITQGHQARVIWGVVQGLDLSAFHEPIQAREGVCGRDATDPMILVALWLYAGTRGVGSARELARLTSTSSVESCGGEDGSRPHQWICGLR